MPDLENPFAPPDVDAPWRPLPSENLATPGKRLVGALIDKGFYAAALLPSVVMLAVAEENGADVGIMDSALDVLFVLFPLLFLVQTVLVATTGRSIGKMIVKTRIVRTDDVAAGFVRGVILRSWLPGIIGFVPLFGSLFGLVDALMVFRQDRQCLHDWFADTKVINQA